MYVELEKNGKEAAISSR